VVFDAKKFMKLKKTICCWQIGKEDPMKKIPVMLMLLFTLILAACSNVFSESQINPTQTSAELSTATELVVGTLKLEGTEQAVTSDQAEGLAFLWQAYQILTSSDTTAQAELDGLIEQIQESMTTEQIRAISDLDLTQEDAFTLLQEQGLGSVQVPQSSSSGTTTQNGAGAPPPDGGMTAMGGGMGDMGGISPDAVAASSASASTQGSSTVPGALMDALIKALQAKIAA
jgi:hypothetical protein